MNWMRILINSIIFLLLTSFFVEQKQSIEVTIKGLKTDIKGNLRIGVFRKNGFPNAGSAIAGKIIPVTHAEMTVKIELNSTGKFALAVVQDQDKNGKLSTNLVGYPTEPYGFSNNKFGKFGPPDFEEVAFQIDQGEHHKLNIQLK